MSLLRPGVIKQVPNQTLPFTITTGLCVLKTVPFHQFLASHEGDTTRIQNVQVQYFPVPIYHPLQNQFSDFFPKDITVTT